jgi:hypothetical protein
VQPMSPGLAHPTLWCHARRSHSLTGDFVAPESPLNEISLKGLWEKRLL